MHRSRDADQDPLTASIIGAAIEVHRHLGPGLLESAYQACLAWELRARDVDIEEQVSVPVIYKGLALRLAYRLDLVVAKAVVVEVKAVEHLHAMTDAQVLTYLKLTGLHTGLVLNFNVPLMRDGVRRLVL